MNMMNPSSSSSQSTAPTWTNTAAPNRSAPIEDHHGAASSSSSSGMDELLRPVSTLDEPVMETIMRDVRAVGAKLKAVLIPLGGNVSYFVCEQKPFLIAMSNCRCMYDQLNKFLSLV